MRLTPFLGQFALILILLGTGLTSHAITIESPKIVLRNIAVDVVIEDAKPGDVVSIVVDGNRISAQAGVDGKATFVGVTAKKSITLNEEDSALRVIPGWLSILPPILAIVLALTIRNVIPALLLGIWIGATVLIGFTPSAFFRGLLNTFEQYVSRAMADDSHARIILFSMMIGGMVGIITRSGGMSAIVKAVIRRARTAVSGQVSVWAMGLVIFFDDYSNTLVVGNTARPIADKLKISREKLAYIVDSTAAPVATIMFITTWVGYQVGLIKDAVDQVPEFNEPAYSIFVNSIPYSFYPIFALIFVLAVAVSGRDFGPMYKAEVRARNGDVKSPSSSGKQESEADDLEPKPDIEEHALIAVLPILVLVAGLMIGLYVTGRTDDEQSLRDIVGAADSYRALMWSSICAALTAAILAIAYRVLDVHETVQAWYSGVRAMLLAMIILVLAWSLSNVTADLNTASYLVSLLQDSLPLALVPAAIFLVSAFTAFSTGTSWGTMGILMPLIIPLTWAIMTVNGAADPAGYHILYSAVACNLAGAVWGDHCSPISDTTVLSSIASGCDHIEHVRTQLPYAMVVGAAAIAIGTIPAGMGLPWWVSILIGVAVLLVVLRVLGKKSDDAVSAS